MPLSRVPTGIAGLDAVLGGGLFKGGIYIVVGQPGVGKTILANQIAFHQTREGRSLYVTLLAETHGRMLAQMTNMSFFVGSAVGDQIKYVNGFQAIEAQGLEGLLALLRGAVREHRANLLVLDGMVTAGVLARSSIDFKKFINELQTWVGIVGCTVLFLTSAAVDQTVQPEHTMVDGIFEMRTRRLGLRALRELTVTKFRGSSFTEGSHPYVITNDGFRVFPRVEGHYVQPPQRSSEYDGRRVSTGLSGLDEMMGGGFPVESSTLVMGPPGSGKTTLALQFLAQGAALDEPALLFGFFERPGALLHKGERIGLPLKRLSQQGHFHAVWQSPAEPVLDILADRLLREVQRLGIRRLVIDGLVGFRDVAYPERLPSFLAALTAQLAELGVTTLFSEDSSVTSSAAGAPGAGILALFDNIVSLRLVETPQELHRVLAVLKTRESAHAREIRRFEIGDTGLTLSPPLRGLGHGSPGSPHDVPGGTPKGSR